MPSVTTRRTSTPPSSLTRCLSKRMPRTQLAQGLPIRSTVSIQTALQRRYHHRETHRSRDSRGPISCTSPKPCQCGEAPRPGEGTATPLMDATWVQPGYRSKPPVLPHRTRRIDPEGTLLSSEAHEHVDCGQARASTSENFGPLWPPPAPCSSTSSSHRAEQIGSVAEAGRRSAISTGTPKCASKWVCILPCSCM